MRTLYYREMRGMYVRLLLSEYLFLTSSDAHIFRLGPPYETNVCLGCWNPSSLFARFVVLIKQYVAIAIAYSISTELRPPSPTLLIAIRAKERNKKQTTLAVIRIIDKTTSLTDIQYLRCKPGGQEYNIIQLVIF